MSLIQKARARIERNRAAWRDANPGKIEPVMTTYTDDGRVMGAAIPHETDPNKAYWFRHPADARSFYHTVELMHEGYAPDLQYIIL